MADAAWDLVTTAFCTPYLPAVLTTAEQANLPTWITAASKAASRWCRRLFVLSTQDEIRSPQQAPDPYAGIPPTVQLSQFPVQSVLSVRGGRVPALTVLNSGAVQRATVQLSFAGDPEICPIPTGLILSRTASGAATASPLLFAGYPTVSALADAITALGNGWSAAVPPAYAAYPSADLIGSWSPRGCLPGQPASLDLFADDLDLADVDLAGGILALSPGGSARMPGLPGQWPGAARDSSFGSFYGQVRVRYTAGWATIPEQVQHAAALAVQSYYWGAKITTPYRSVKQGNVAYELADPRTDLPPMAMAILSKFRRHEA